jgi:CRISPR type I-E-associated protein CasB/Cse2
MPPDDDAPNLRELVRRVAERLHNPHYGTGPLAELRRMDPRSPTAPAFYRLLAEMPEQAPLNAAQWALLIHAMALAGPGLLNGREELGKSLFDAGYKEGRLTRLLQARASDLPDMVPRLVRYLAAKGQTLNLVGLAYFIWAIGKGGEPAEQARERIARHYYRAEYQAGKTPQPSASIGSSA